MRVFTAQERTERPTAPVDPLRRHNDGDGPKSPDVKRPDPSDLLKRMRKVDPEQAKKYRQRSGE